MKKKGTFVIAILVVLMVIVLGGSYNRLISSQTDVEQEKSNIDTQLQRRMDLIPNLVETVKGYTKHETEVFDGVTKSRQNMLNAATMKDKYTANEEMTTALNGLVAVAEDYPELKSDTVYLGLMDELAGTENRIAVARLKYNKIVTNYNKTIRKFPTNLFANLCGFYKEELFEASEGAKVVPKIHLD